MASELREKVNQAMSRTQTHNDWEQMYRTDANEAAHERSYDRITEIVDPPADARALDIGCGICANSLRLARRGFRVEAGDYSDAILERARDNVAISDFSDKINISKQNILKLDFPDNHFDLVLCWGVLMHIPDIDEALAELVRVARPGGHIVLEEIPMRTPESVLMRLYWRTLKRHITITRTPAGYQHEDRFIWRHIDPTWLQRTLGDHGCELVDRSAGLFTELYRFAPAGPIRRAFDAVNYAYPRWVKLPALASHNVFVFRKKAEQ